MDLIGAYMEVVLPKPGDPTCLRCPSGPYTKHGKPKPFVRGLCGSCWYAADKTGTLDMVALPKASGRKRTRIEREPRPPRVPRPVPACGLGGCTNPVVVVGGVPRRRCSAHRSRRTVEYAPAVKLVERECSGCGATVTRAYSPYTQRSYCSWLCKRYVLSGPWFEPSRVKFPKPEKPEKRLLSCAWCATEFLERGPKRFCGPRCHEKAYDCRRRAREAGVAGEYAWSDVVRLWKKFGERCAYCREALALPDLQAEHVVPISRGGLNAVSNLLPSCGPCNASKRDLGLAEWAAWREVKKWPPVATEWASDDPLYSHLALGAADMALIAA